MCQQPHKLQHQCSHAAVQCCCMCLGVAGVRTMAGHIFCYHMPGLASLVGVPLEKSYITMRQMHWWDPQWFKSARA